MTESKPGADPAAVQEELELLREFKARSLRREAELQAMVRELQDTRAALQQAHAQLATSQREIQQAHREWHAAFDAETDLIFLYDKSYRIVRANRAYAERAGMAPEEVIGKRYWEVFPKMGGPLPESRATEERGAAGDAGYEFRLESGEVFLSRNSPVPGETGEYLCTLHILQDITKHDRMASAYGRNRLVLKMLGECLLEMARATSEPQLVQAVCRALVEKYGYRLAWLGYAEQDRRDAASPVIFFGHRSEHLEMRVAGPADAENEINPAAAAIRARRPSVFQNVLNDPRFASLRRDAGRTGYASILALPLLDQGSALGALCIYAVEPFAFDAEEVRLLQSLAADIVFGITTFRVRAERDTALDEHEEYLSRLRESLEAAIESIAAAIEMNNSRSSTHQTRVGGLAMAIATEMDLPRERCRGIRLAGIVHDLGELQVPAEIHRKTGKLTEAELNLEKKHAQCGYDILKRIEFPWPIAETVLQHHERLDGSGYPNGLKGDEILLEAKIIGLADSIVSMAYEQRFHRPRLGILAALAEVEKGKGRLFDAAVVDAALRLFLEKACVIA